MMVQGTSPVEAKKDLKVAEEYQMAEFMQESKDWAPLRSKEDLDKFKKGSISFALIPALRFKNKFSNLQFKVG